MDVNLSEESGMYGSGNKTLLKLLEQGSQSTTKTFISSNQNTPTVHRAKKASEGDVDKLKSEDIYRRHALRISKLESGKS